MEAVKRAYALLQTLYSLVFVHGCLQLGLRSAQAADCFWSECS